MSVPASLAILDEARRLTGLGVRAFDAVHVACAVEGACDLFVTTDDMLIKRLAGYDRVRPLPLLSTVLDGALAHVVDHGQNNGHFC